MVENAQEAFKRHLRDVVAPQLREHGLRGSGQSYVLPDPAWWALIGVQKSAYSTALAVKFTVNLSAVSKRAWDEARREHSYLKDTPPPDIDRASWDARRLEESYYPARPSANTLGGGSSTRIGHLIPGVAADHWWTLTTDNAKDVLSDAAQAIVSWGLPWLRQAISQASHRPTGLP